MLLLKMIFIYYNGNDLQHFLISLFAILRDFALVIVDGALFHILGASPKKLALIAMF